MQDDDPSVHGETDAFRNAGRRRSYRDTVMVTTLSPCWYCSGLVRQFGISAVVDRRVAYICRRGRRGCESPGSRSSTWTRPDCYALLQGFIAEHPEVWNEDIGE